MAAKRLLSIRLITALAAAVLSMQPAGADEGKLYTADKMSSSTISCITQDAYGFVWVGTEYGLNRFDGYQFVKYFQSAVDSTSLVSNEVTTFHVDSHQQLWIGCRKGLVRYDYTADAFERFTFPGGIEPRVASIAEDADGNMIIGTTGYGLYLLPADSRLIVRPSRFRRKYADDFVTRAFYDAQGNLWCGNMSAQLTCYMHSDSTQAPPRTFDTGCGSVVSSFATDRRGIYIVCTYGILYYDYQRAKLRRSSFDLSALEGNISIRDAYPDSEGNLFIGTFDVANALKDAMAATRFGLPFKHKPIKVTGWYKFKAGEHFQNRQGQKVDRTDQPDIYCVMYRNQDSEGNQVLLYGDDVLSSKAIVGLARITGVVETDEWTQFEMAVEYSQELDDNLLENNGYSMTLSMASSIEGASFEGAPGSIFCVDNVVIECEY